MDETDLLVERNRHLFLELVTLGWRPNRSRHYFHSPRVINFKCPLQPHQEYNTTQYEELGFSSLTQMKDDYTTNSRNITYTFLFKRLGEYTFWTWEWKRLYRSQCRALQLVSAQYFWAFVRGTCALVCNVTSFSCYCSDEEGAPCLRLIDFGRSIDLQLFPAGTSFTVDCHTDTFQCIEMRTCRPWTTQVGYIP